MVVRCTRGHALSILLCISLALLITTACARSAPTPRMEEATPRAALTPAFGVEEELELSPTPLLPTEAPKAKPTEALAEVAPSEALPSETREPALPPEPQTVAFTAEDGQNLEGVYYPAASNPAPIVVLMHWARGDDSDWVEIAYWLQNRGQSGQTDPREPWLDPSWFPPVPDGSSFAVFTFTFRGCGGGAGCREFQSEGWLLDAKAAVAAARGLEGVDPERLVTIGASIGADGAVDACGDGCRGALSLSPGSYLSVPYPEAVSGISGSDPPRPAWCLGAEGDGDVVALCERASGELYRVFVYEGPLHGMQLIQAGMEPSVPRLILEFLDLALGG